METIIEFLNERKEILRGVLHTPTTEFQGGRRHLFIFPNGGVMGAEGDYRAHVAMARHLTCNGLYVLRFSPAGLGYSDGNIADCRQKNLFGQIESGLFVKDIKASVEFAGSFGRFDSITLCGICGGAISSYLAAAVIEEVTGVIPIGVPVVLDSDDLDYSRRMPKYEAKWIVKSYWDKIFSLKAWMRLVSMQSEVKKIKEAFLVLFSPKSKYLESKNPAKKVRANPYFINVTEKLLKKKKKILFIFGSNDGFWMEFEKLYLIPYFGKDAKLPFDYYLSPYANHMVSMSEMQFDVSCKIMDWIGSK